jgi:hypothetical protein
LFKPLWQPPAKIIFPSACKVTRLLLPVPKRDITFPFEPKAVSIVPFELYRVAQKNESVPLLVHVPENTILPSGWIAIALATAHS